MTAFELRLLGGASLHTPDGTPITGRAVHRHRLALLALLARATPHGLSRDKLVGLLWPERDEASARHLLRAALHDLRQTLGAETLTSHGNELRLGVSRCAVDMLRFESLRREGDLAAAAAAYRGPFLDGFFLERAELFDQWLLQERTTLASAYESALRTLARQADAEGNTEQARQWWQQLSLLCPADGQAAQEVVQRALAADDPAAALAHARRHARYLRDELGIGPDRELTALVESIRRERVALQADWLEEPTEDASEVPSVPVVEHEAVPPAEPVYDVATPSIEPAHATTASDATPSVSPPPVRTTALTPSTVHTTGTFRAKRARSRRRVWAMGFAAAIAVAILPLLWNSRTAVGAEHPGADRSGITARTTVVAVAPFDVVPGVPKELAQGVAMLLSANLDQVAELRIIPSSTVSAKRGDSADATDPRVLLPAVRAELLVAGVISPAPEGIAVSVRLLDTAGVVRARVELRGSANDLAQVVDQTSVQLLRAVWGQQLGVPTPRLAAISTASTPALRAFLRGEAFVRAAMWDSAAGALAEAVDIDSTFALAHLRLAEPYGWRYGMASEPSQRALAAAERFASRLPPRERMLLTVRRLHEAGRLPALDSVVALAARYPDDAEVQYVAADVRYHAMEALGRTMSERAVAAFDTAIALDSVSARVYAHPVTLALMLGDSARFRTITRKLVALRGGSHMQVADDWDYPWLAQVRFDSPGNALRHLRAKLSQQRPPTWQLVDVISSFERAVIQHDARSTWVVDSVHQLLRTSYAGVATAQGEVDLRRAVWLSATGRLDEARPWLERMWEVDPYSAPSVMVMPVVFGYAPRTWLDGADAHLDASPYWQETPARRRRATYWKGVFAVLRGDAQLGRTLFRKAGDPSAFGKDTSASRTADVIGPGFSGALRSADAWARVQLGDSSAWPQMERALRDVGYEGDALLLSRATRAWYTLALQQQPARRDEAVDRMRGELVRLEGYRWAWWWLAQSRALAAKGDRAGAAAARRRFDLLWSGPPVDRLVAASSTLEHAMPASPR